MRSPDGWTAKCLSIGRCGRASGSRPLRAPRRRSKAATAICHKCITIIGGCPSGATKCGPSCITLIVALRMAQPRQLAFSAGRFRIFLKGFYPTSMPCRGRGNAVVLACEVVDVMNCPALSGYPSWVSVLGGTLRRLNHLPRWPDDVAWA